MDFEYKSEMLNWSKKNNVLHIFSPTGFYAFDILGCELNSLLDEELVEEVDGDYRLTELGDRLKYTIQINFAIDLDYETDDVEEPVKKEKDKYNKPITGKLYYNGVVIKEGNFAFLNYYKQTLIDENPGNYKRDLFKLTY
jgi:hypothetical protein